MITVGASVLTLDRGIFHLFQIPFMSMNARKSLD